MPIAAMPAAGTNAMPDPVRSPAAHVPAAPGRGDTPAEARGRRILSTAFVRTGPDGLLTIWLRDGRALVLRDMAMGAREYCGRPVPAGAAGKRHCGGYGDIAAARPGDGHRTP